MKKRTYIARVTNDDGKKKIVTFRAFNELHALLRLIEKFKDDDFQELTLNQIG